MMMSESGWDIRTEFPRFPHLARTAYRSSGCRDVRELKKSKSRTSRHPEAFIYILKYIFLQIMCFLKKPFLAFLSVFSSIHHGYRR